MNKQIKIFGKIHQVVKIESKDFSARQKTDHWLGSVQGYHDDMPVIPCKKQVMIPAKHDCIFTIKNSKGECYTLNFESIKTFLQVMREFK